MKSIEQLRARKKNRAAASNEDKFNYIWINLFYEFRGYKKKELIAYISKTNDEQILSILREEIVHYGEVKEEEATEQLSEVQVAELQFLYNEDEAVTSESLSSFRKKTERWRTK